MSKQTPIKRWIAALLAIAMVIGIMPTNVVHAADTFESLSFTRSDIVPNPKLPVSVATEEGQDISTPAYADSDVVRVSIVLEKKSTIDAGYPIANIADNSAAMAYRSRLKVEQETITDRIEATALAGETLDVVWNLTLAANIISANVKFGQIEDIKNVNGVANVFVETQYAPAVIDRNLTNDPNMATSSEQIGSNNAWLAGYTGAGRRIAIIDTGIDDEHQSFDGKAYEYALTQLVDEKGQDYVDSLKLLTVADIEGKLSELNAGGYKYVSGKIPFAYNYVDRNTNINHLGDAQGEHGSHVAGIASANRFVDTDGDGVYEKALDAVMVQGVAPDAQIITMKVFGSRGGAYDSDYFAAVEDAIILGCDSANLSLGSTVAGFGSSGTYEDILNRLVESGLVMVTSGGNNYSWPTFANNGVGYPDTGTVDGYLYADDVNYATGGSPGSFTNTLSVASIDNIGTTDKYLEVEGTKISYNESAQYGNPVISNTLGGGTYDFVYIDLAGKEEQFEEIKDIVKGKVAVCNRGEVSFYVKANNAYDAGAIAVIIVNNDSANNMNMDLTGYYGDIPAVLVPKATAGYFKANWNDLGGVAVDGYYTGKITVSAGAGSVMGDSTTMSSFSSWGIPGTLELKPEITAPGGNIYSVWGANAATGPNDSPTTSHSSYENMSGTSMAAPQISGMIAVVDQFLTDEGVIDEFDSTERRAIAISLLMSTAVPQEEDFGEYGSGWYPVIRQGAGVANVGNAVSALSYIMMGADATASYADGKVKAELGDDPDRNGVYDYSFTVNDLLGQESNYTLSTDIFTQDLTTDGVNLYLDNWTTPLSANVTYTVDGVTFVPRAGVDADVNMDGVTDAKDAQALLDYIVGNVEASELNLAVGDLDNDNDITTYDAHLILSTMTTDSFTVPADGSVTVKVHIELNDSYLNYYENGAYIEGYTFVNPVATEEGVIGAGHSIPILGFYGSWTDPSMFDHGSSVDKLYGDTSKPYVVDSDEYAWNYLTYKDSVDGKTYTQIGNPYGIEAEYPEGKAAIRSADTLYQLGFTLIRNAGTMGAVIENKTTGEVFIPSNPTSFGQYNYAAYYSQSSGAWSNTGIALTLNQKASKYAKNGDIIDVSFVAIPEYYLTAEQRASQTVTADEFADILDELGEGAFMKTTLNVDDVAPEVLKASKDLTTKDLTITATDNFDIAYMAVMTKSGTKVYADVLAPEAVNGVVEYTFAVGDMGIGSKCLVFIGDYAGNETAVIVEYGGKDPDYTGKLIAFANGTSSTDVHHNWVTLDPATVNYTSAGLDASTGVQSMGVTNAVITAAEYIDGYVFYTVGTSAATLQLYVAELLELDNPLLIGTLTKGTSVTNALTSVSELAYNVKDGLLYAMDATNYNRIYTINPLTGVYEQVSNGVTVSGLKNTSSYNGIKAMAIDDDGVFYGVTYGYGTSGTGVCRVVKWELNGIGTADAEVLNSSTGITNYAGDMAYDHVNKALYFASSTTTLGANNRLYKIDTNTGDVEETNSDSQLYFYPSALMLIGNLANTPSFGETSDVEGLTLSANSLSIMLGGKETLTYTITPWTLTDKTVTWSVDDDTVVSVDDNGVVTGLKEGTAVVTATANADNTTTATCTVTVTPLPDIALSALIYDTDSETYWSDYNVNDTMNWAKIPGGEESGYYMAGGLGLDKMLYVHDGSTMYGVDPDTFEVTVYGSIASSWTWSDAAPAPTVLASEGFQIVGLCNGGQFLELLIPSEGSLSYFDLSTKFAEDPMAAIAYGYLANGFSGVTENYYVVTESGALYRFSFNASGSLSQTALGNVGVELTGVSDVRGSNYASMYFSGNSSGGYLVLTTYTNGDDSAKMNLIKVGTTAATTKLVSTTEFGAEIWPVVSNYTYERATDLTIKTTSPSTIEVTEGNTYQLVVRAILGATNEIEYSTSDSSIAVVDGNGLISAVSPGVAVITATTKDVGQDGLTRSLSFTVIVEGIPDVSFTGVLANGNQANLFDWNVKANSMITGLTISQNVLNAADADESGFYLMDSAYKMHKLSKTDVSELENGPWQWDTSSITPWDIDNSGLGFTWSYGYYLMVGDDPTNPSYRGFNLGQNSNYNYPFFYGVAVLDETWDYTLNGTTYSGDQILYAIDDTNRVFEILLYNGGQNALIGYSSSDLTVAPAFDYQNDDSPRTSLIVDSDGTLYYSVPVNGHVEVYSLVANSSGYKSTLVATTNADAAFLLDVRSNATNSGNSVVRYGNYQVAEVVPVDLVNAVLPYKAPASYTYEETIYDDSVSITGTASIWAPVYSYGNQFGGYLNSISVESTENSDGSKTYEVVDTENHTVTIRVKAEESTNGLVTVKYDPSVLTYVSTTGLTTYYAYSVDEAAGTIVVDYASKNELNQNVAEIVFSYADDVEEDVDTSITVTPEQDNNDFNGSAAEEIDVTLPGTGHSFGAPTWEWSEDNTSATAAFTCTTDDSHVEKVTATVTSETIAATCDTDGVITYTATVEFGGNTYVTTKIVTIPATGHRFNNRGVCEVCGKSDPDYVAPHRHNFLLLNDNVYHWMYCFGCGVRLNFGEHVYVDGVCTACGYHDIFGGAFDGSESDGDVVDIETPTQGIGGDEDPEDIGVTDPEPSPAPESNPHTGLAFSAFTLAMAAAVSAISKRK